MNTKLALLIGNVVLFAGLAQAAVPLTAWDEDFSGTSLNSNLTVKQAVGTGTGVTLDTANDSLVMNLQEGSKHYRAVVYTRASQTGVTTYEGNALYDYSAHTVSTHFDLNAQSMANETGRFRVQMGNLNIGNSDATTDPGFAVDLYYGGGEWRLEVLEDGVKTLKALTSRPDSVGFDVSGTSLTYWAEGTIVESFTYTLDASNVNNLVDYGLVFGAKGYTNDTDPGNPGAYDTNVILDSFEVTVVPEPAMAAMLLGLGALGTVFGRRRR